MAATAWWRGKVSGCDGDAEVVVVRVVLAVTAAGVVTADGGGGEVGWSLAWGGSWRRTSDHTDNKWRLGGGSG